MQWIRYRALQHQTVQKSREKTFQDALIQSCTNLETDALQQYFNKCAPYKVREAMVRFNDFFEYLWKLHPEDWWVRRVQGKNSTQDNRHTLRFEVYAGNQPIPYAGFSISYDYTFGGQLNDLFISHYYILSDTLLMQN